MQIHRKHNGFTLIEAMVAVGIAAVGFIAALTLINFMVLQNQLEQERARAHQIVTEEMERIRLDLFSHITAGTSTTVWDNGTPDDTSDDTNGTLEVIVRDLDGNTLAAAPVPAEAVEVEVTLSWTPRGRTSDKTFRETVMAYVVPE